MISIIERDVEKNIAKLANPKPKSQAPELKKPKPKLHEVNKQLNGTKSILETAQSSNQSNQVIINNCRLFMSQQNLPEASFNASIQAIKQFEVQYARNQSVIDMMLEATRQTTQEYREFYARNQAIKQTEMMLEASRQTIKQYEIQYSLVQKTANTEIKHLNDKVTFLNKFHAEAKLKLLAEMTGKDHTINNLSNQNKQLCDDNKILNKMNAEAEEKYLEDVVNNKSPSNNEMNFEIKPQQLYSMSFHELSCLEKLLRQSLQIVQQETTSRKECKICLADSADVMFLPCTHLVTCTRCSKQIKDCPICRLKIEQSIPLGK